MPVPFGCSSQCGTGKTGGANTPRKGKGSSAGILHPHSSCSCESWQRVWLFSGPGWSWGHTRVFPYGLSMSQAASRGKGALVQHFTFSMGGLWICPSEHQALIYVLQQCHSSAVDAAVNQFCPWQPLLCELLLQSLQLRDFSSKAAAPKCFWGL